MKKKSSLNSFSTLFLNRLGINYITKSNGSTEESTVRGANRHKDKDRMKTKSECIYLTKESGSKKSATTDVPSKSLYFNNLEQDEDKTDEEENEEDAFRGSTLVENHQRSSPSIGAFKSNPNLTETKSSSRKKGSDGIKRFKKGLNKKLNRKFGSGKSSSTKNVDESSSKKSRQASTPSHRDSGIIADIFSNIGSMNNIKSKFNSAKSSLRNSLSVFSLKVSTSSNLNGIDLGTGTVTGVSSSSSSSTKSASLVSKKKKSSCPPNSEPVSTFTSSSVHNFDHGSSMMLISDTVGAGSAASAVTASNSTSSSNHHHQHHHHQSFTSSTNSSANSNRLDMLSKEARADRIHNANQKFDANINSKSMSNLNKYSIYSTKSTASSSSTKSSSVLSSSVLSAASSCMSSSSSTSSRDGAIEKDEQTSRQQQQHRMLLRRSVTGEYDEDENNNADEEDGDEEEEGEDREQEESEAERRLVDLQQHQDANEISKNNSMRERASKSEEFEIKIQNETDQIHQQKATKMNATRDEFFVIKNKLNEMNNSARNKKSIDEGAAAAATVATQYFSNQMHNKFKLSQQQQQQQQALSVSSNKLSMNANGSYYTYLPRNKASLQAQLGQRQPQSKSFKMPDQRQLGQENTASLRRTTTFHSTKTNPSNLFEASVRKYSTSDENSNAKSTLRPGSVLANRVNCNCNQCKKDSQHMPTGFTSSLKSTKSNHSTHLSSILKQPTTQTVSTTQQRITADHLRPKNYGSFSATSNSSYNTLNLSSFNVNNSTNNRASPSQQKQFQQQYVPSSGANKFTSSMSSTTLFTTTSNKPSAYQCSHDKMESQTIVSSTSLPPVEKSDGTAMEQQASNTEQPMAKTSEVTTTIRMTSTSSVKGVAEMADSNSTSNSSFNSRHQKVVVQASTSDLLRCFATFISHRCAHLIRSSSESSASGHHHSQRSASNKFDPRDTIIWLRSADRVLLAQGWQEIQFMNPVNVVFVYLLMRESLKPSEIKTVYDLQCNIMACLYLAFSYMGNEISYPLKPFIIEENRDVFWQRTVNLMNQLSGCMLKINQDPRFFTELFYELRSYSNVNLLTPSKTLTSIPNTANHSFKKPINQKPTTNNKPSEVNMATAAPTVDAKPEQPTVAKHNNSTASCNSHTPAYTSSAPAAVSYSLSTSSIASKLASSQPFHQQLKLSTFTFNTKQQQLTDVCSNTMSSPSGISGKAHVSSTSSNATPASAPPPTIANNKSNGNSEIRYRQFNQLYNQFNRPDVLTQLN